MPKESGSDYFLPALFIFIKILHFNTTEQEFINTINNLADLQLYLTKLISQLSKVLPKYALVSITVPVMAQTLEKPHQKHP